MYDSVYATYCGEIGVEKRRLAVAIVPGFGTSLRKFEEDRVYWCVDDQILKDEQEREKEILLPQKTQWLLEAKAHSFFRIIVTEYTQRIQTPFEPEMNWIINEKVKEAQREYQKSKKTQMRLYLYDAKRDTFTLYTNGTSFYNSGCQYPLDRPFVSYSAIDRRYPTPAGTCFILGKVRRTIGTKNGKLMDFIEPIARFELDDSDYFYNEMYWQGNKIFVMLRFSIQKDEPSASKIIRIRNEEHCNVPEFLKRLNTALEGGDIEKVNRFYDIIYK